MGVVSSHLLKRVERSNQIPGFSKLMMATKVFLLVFVGVGVLIGTAKANEESDQIINAEISQLEKLKAILHDKTDEEILQSLDQDGNGRISKQEVTNFLESEGLINAGMEISDELWKALTGGEIEIEFDQSAGNTEDRWRLNRKKVVKWLKVTIA